MQTGVGGGQRWEVGTNISGSLGEFAIRDSTNSVTALSILKGSGNATFAGGVTVNSAAATGTMNVSGTGYWTGLTAESGTKSTLCIDPVTMQIETNAAATCTVSALKYKENISPIDPSDALSVVLQMQPSYFDYKSGEKNQVGFIGDWSPVEALIDRDTKGKVSGFKYENFTAYLAGAMQEQQRQIEDLKRQVAELKAKHE